jgi:hypothetical protein
MIEYWIIVTAGVVGIFLVLCLAVLIFLRQERKFFRDRVLLKTYIDLLEAVTELNEGRGDEYRTATAKRRIAATLNRLNLLAGQEVLLHVSELLDFLNESRNRDLDLAREHQILNAIAIAARRSLDPAGARELEEARIRFRFYAPPKQP